MGPILDLSPAPLQANLNINAQLSIPVGNAGLKLEETAGILTFKASDLKSKAVSIPNEMAGVLDIPALNIGNFGGNIEFARKRAQFIDFKLGDQDFEGLLSGHLDLAPKFDNINANAHIFFDFNVDFVKRTPLITTMAALQKKYFQKQPDASFLFGILLKGKISKLKTQPKIHSPFSKEGRQQEKDEIKNNPNPNIANPANSSAKPALPSLPTTPVVSNGKGSLPPPMKPQGPKPSLPAEPPMPKANKPIPFPQKQPPVIMEQPVEIEVEDPMMQPSQNQNDQNDQNDEQNNANQNDNNEDSNNNEENQENKEAQPNDILEELQ